MKPQKVFLLIKNFASQGKIKGAGFEITKNCNLKCKHCYRRDFQGEDLTDEKWLEIFKNLKDKGYSQVAWAGGEPLLRKKLIGFGKEYFPINVLITNGTIPLPQWDDVLFGVSLDGTPAIYEKIRGSSLKGQYDLVKKNILDGVKNGNKIYVLMTLNKLNKNVLEEFTKLWLNTGVKGMIFDFYTPQKDKINDPLWLSFKERDEVIEQISQLRKQYEDFLPWNTQGVLEKMKSKNCKKYTDKCQQQTSNEGLIKLSYKGKRLFPCVMGAESLAEAKIDCDRCGCIFAFPFDSQALWTSIKAIFF